MTTLPGKFNPADIPADDRSFEPIPAGLYKLQVVDSRLQDTKSGSGQMLVLTLDVLEGQYANRKIWDQLNIINDNPEAQRIAQRALADLCLLVGVQSLTDSEQLHFKPFTARVTIVPDKTGQYGPQNRVRYTVGGAQATSAAPKGGSGFGRQPAKQQPQGKPAAQSGAGTKPWNQPKQAAPASGEPDDQIPF